MNSDEEEEGRRTLELFGLSVEPDLQAGKTPPKEEKPGDGTQGAAGDGGTGETDVASLRKELQEAKRKLKAAEKERWDAIEAGLEEKSKRSELIGERDNITAEIKGLYRARGSVGDAAHRLAVLAVMVDGTLAGGAFLLKPPRGPWLHLLVGVAWVGFAFALLADSSSLTSLSAWAPAIGAGGVLCLLSVLALRSRNPSQAPGQMW